MITYSLSSEPNFEISVTPETNTYVLHFQFIRGLMYVTIKDTYGVIISGPIRICEGRWLITTEAYNYEGAGNFVVVEATRQYPMFEDFASSCELRYYSRDEIEAMQTSEGV